LKFHYRTAFRFSQVPQTHKPISQVLRQNQYEWPLVPFLFRLAWISVSLQRKPEEELLFSPLILSWTSPIRNANIHNPIPKRKLTILRPARVLQLLLHQQHWLQASAKVRSAGPALTYMYT
jgi:hypothetical protein